MAANHGNALRYHGGFPWECLETSAGVKGLSYLTVDKTISACSTKKPHAATVRSCHWVVFRVAARSVTSDLTINDMILLLSIY